MTLPEEDNPTIAMSPPHFASLNSDIIELRPQFPMNNQQHFLENSFKRARISANNRYNANEITNPPLRMNQPSNNRGTSRMFYKTRICVKFRLGHCQNGENCNFAHGVDEIRQPPPNWQDLVGSRSEERVQMGGIWEEDKKIIQKMKLCKKYYNGEECPYGDNCSFLHEDPAKLKDDSWKSRESSAISIGTIDSSKAFVDGSNDLGDVTVIKPARGTYWKTKLCLKWQNTGNCPFGYDCHFAHGEAELQAPGVSIEAEAALAKSAKASIPTLPKYLSANNAPATLPTNLPITKEEEKDKKHLLESKLSKINRIYGDWIDDLPLVLPNLPSAVET